MKFWLSVLSVAIVSFLCGLYLPWWSVAIPAFFTGLLMPQQGMRNFLSGFLGVFLLWLGLTLWIDSANEGVLALRMAQILPVGGQVVYLHVLTAFLGGMLGGLASLSGKYLRSLVPDRTF